MGEIRSQMEPSPAADKVPLLIREPELIKKILERTAAAHPAYQYGRLSPQEVAEESRSRAADLLGFLMKINELLPIAPEDLAVISRDPVSRTEPILSKHWPFRTVIDIRKAVRQYAELCLKLRDAEDDENFSVASARAIEDLPQKLGIMPEDDVPAPPVGEEAKAEQQIAENLRNARRAARLTQDQLAERSGVSQAQISQLEKGKWFPRVDVLMALARALGVSTADLLPRDT